MTLYLYPISKSIGRSDVTLVRKAKYQYPDNQKDYTADDYSQRSKELRNAALLNAGSSAFNLGMAGSHATAYSRGDRRVKRGIKNWNSVGDIRNPKEANKAKRAATQIISGKKMRATSQIRKPFGRYHAALAGISAGAGGLSYAMSRSDKKKAQELRKTYRTLARNSGAVAKSMMNI